MIFVEFHHVLQGVNIVNISCAKIVGVTILDFISCYVTSQNLVICRTNLDNLLIALIIVSFPSLSRAESGGSVTRVCHMEIFVLANLLHCILNRFRL